MLARAAINKYTVLCDRAELSRGAAAKLIGVSRTTLNNWEKAATDGKDVGMFVSKLEAILSACSVLEKAINSGQLPGQERNVLRL